MSRSPEVTVEEILAAGKRILARGEPVTGWGLRKELGNRGSAPRLEAVWKGNMGDHLDGAAAEQDAPILPPEVTALLAGAKMSMAGQVEAFANALYRSVLEFADGQYKAEIESLRGARVQYKREMGEAELAIEVTDAQLAEYADNVAAIEKRLVAADTTRIRLEERLQAAAERHPRLA